MPFIFHYAFPNFYAKLSISLKKFKLYLLQYPYRIRTFINNSMKGAQNEKVSTYNSYTSRPT
ncbi:hypothetical protein Bmyc01_31700 [Bacillus mycoides]|nr:hypothetical protein Bmyc01_31700 [Bacillus mycoides]